MKTLVLVGGGHSHLYCLKQLTKETSLNCRVVLISPSIHQYYSGMFSGFAEDLYDLEDIRIDLKQLSDYAGAEFIADRIVALDAGSKQLFGMNGTVYEYDLVSFDIGSDTSIPEDMKQPFTANKPNYLFPDRLLQARESARPVIVGGGAAGVELAFSIHAWRKQNQLPLNSILLSSTALLSDNGKRAATSVESIAKRKSLPFFTGHKVEGIDGDSILTSTGQSFSYSDVLWVAGPASFELFKEANVPTDDQGFLLVTDELQAVEHTEIFGAGDCVTVESYPSIPKNGVLAIRQGPILWRNLKNMLASEKLISFVPQKRVTSILSTGDGEALLINGGMTFHGRIPMKLKQHIDRKFMKRYKDIYE